MAIDGGTLFSLKAFFCMMFWKTILGGRFHIFLEYHGDIFIIMSWLTLHDMSWMVTILNCRHGTMIELIWWRNGLSNMEENSPWALVQWWVEESDCLVLLLFKEHVLVAIHTTIIGIIFGTACWTWTLLRMSFCVDSCGHVADKISRWLTPSFASWMRNILIRGNVSQCRVRPVFSKTTYLPIGIIAAELYSGKDAIEQFGL